MDSLYFANEGVLQSPKPPALNTHTGAGPAGHLGRLWSHFLCSFDRRHANLKAAPEVAQTNSLYYELDPAFTQAFPSMYVIEGTGL